MTKFTDKHNAKQPIHKKAWTIFSKYVRFIRDKGVCYTCGVKKDPKDMDAGHYKHSDCLDFDEMNVHCQCLTKESNILMFNGTHKSIKDIKINDKIWGFDENTFEKKLSIVKDIENFIPDELYEVELENGNKFYATSDHKVVANYKWITISDMLHNVVAYDIMQT